MKKLITFSITGLAMFSGCALFAQSSIHASGNSVSNDKGSITYSVRHVSFVSEDETNGSISEGTAHPFEIFVYQSVEEQPRTTLNYKAYPNPVSTELQLQILDDDFTGLQFIITDMNGRTVNSSAIQHSTTSINMTDYTEGMYFLTVVSDKNEKFNTYKIIKH